MSHVRHLSDTSAQIELAADSSLPIEAVPGRYSPEPRRENLRRMNSENPVKSTSRWTEGSPPLCPCLNHEATVLEPWPLSAVAESNQQELSPVRGTSRAPVPVTLRIGRSKSAAGAMHAGERGDLDESKDAGGLAKREKKSTGILGFLSAKKTRYSSPGHGKERGVLGSQGARVIIGGDGGADTG